MPDDPDDPVAEMSDLAHHRSMHIGAGYVVIAHGLGRFMRELMDAGFTRDEAMDLVRDKGRAFWAQANYEAGPALPPGPDVWGMTSDPSPTSSESSGGSVTNFSAWREQQPPE